MLSVKPALIAEVETMRGHVWNQCVVLFHRIDLRYHGLTYVPIAFDSKQWIQNFERHVLHILKQKRMRHFDDSKTTAICL